MLIEIHTGGAAFHSFNEQDEMLERYALTTELDKLFREIYSSIRHDSKTEGTLIDSNGNNVGHWSLNDDKNCKS